MNAHYATPEGTVARAKKHAGLSFASLGDTKLMVSQAGFGCYRIRTEVPEHEQALRLALAGGINLIDTSANYTDGASEILVGKVLNDLVASGEITRNQVVLVTKGGYLQGKNLVISRKRKAEGKPFQDLVEYEKDLEHCIHPDFLENQISLSLERLQLETIDAYLLHNPEYYLGWAAKNAITPGDAKKEYHRRIRNAFHHLEKEVKRGRIRYYGISSNTFPERSDHPEFTSLETICDIAASLPPHHFRLIQLPFNLLEPGAALEKNQPGNKSVLESAHERKIGLLVNRPLNAFSQNHMVRLADIKAGKRQDYNEIIKRVRAVTKSETVLWRTIIPDLDIPTGLRVRIKEQIAIGDSLKHYWKNFGSHERFRQAKAVHFMPRVQGVMNFLKPYREGKPSVDSWMESHMGILEQAFEAVASIYIEDAARITRKIHAMVTDAAADWGTDIPLSQKAVRAIRSTEGVSAVLVGMRKEKYVKDVLAELSRPLEKKGDVDAWKKMADETKTLFP
jgi:aryl-alcohol dehydrogenase-like predicted oxidoreductase